MDVCGQPHATATSPAGKEPLIPTGKEAGWAPKPVWTQWRKKKSLPLPGLEPPIIQPVAQRSTTELCVKKLELTSVSYKYKILLFSNSVKDDLYVGEGG
jgi:hypothetical protein